MLATSLVCTACLYATLCSSAAAALRLALVRLPKMSASQLAVTLAFTPLSPAEALKVAPGRKAPLAAISDASASSTLNLATLRSVLFFNPSAIHSFKTGSVKNSSQET